MNIETIILIIVTVVNILGQMSIVIFGFRKLPKEERKLDTEADKSASEAIEASSRALRNYSEEINKLKEASALMEKKYEERIRRAEDRILVLETEQVQMTKYVRELLEGIERLIGQIKMRGDVPVWQPQKLEE